MSSDKTEFQNYSNKLFCKTCQTSTPEVRPSRSKLLKIVFLKDMSSGKIGFQNYFYKILFV